MSARPATRPSVADKMILAGGAASLALCSGNFVEGAIIASPNAPIGPPTTAGNNLLDVDGDGTNDFQLSNDSSSSASLIESNGGRFVATFNAISDGFAKLPSGFVVGPTMFGAKFFSNPQSGIGVTSSSEIGRDAGQQGWSMGQTGYFGFKFTSGANTYYGWGEIELAPALSGTRGHGFQFSRLYYENTGAPIAIGDTGGAIPEPSTCALALLAAGGVAAYRARRKVTAA
ncbi:MAG: PEP-CTERM sorting domain-containing protein [Planctomycetaceae bacterium]